MKTIVQLLIAALVINASFQAARSAWKYYSFKDALYQEVLHGGATTTSNLHQRVLEIAQEHEIALEWKDVEVRKQGEATTVATAYVDPIALVPRFYTREWVYEPTVSVRRVRPLTVDDIK